MVRLILAEFPSAHAACGRGRPRAQYRIASATFSRPSCCACQMGLGCGLIPHPSREVQLMNAVSHVAIGVRDMERSLRFYRDLLGMEVRSDNTQPLGGVPRVHGKPENGQGRRV